MQGWALGAHRLPSRGRRAVLAAAGSQACCRADGPGPLEGSTRPAARAEPAAPSSSPQQPCGAGCSGTVPFTAKRTITRISPSRFHNNPPPKEGGGVIYISIYIKAGLFHSSLSPPTQHSIKRTKPDILFADLASIKQFQ